MIDSPQTLPPEFTPVVGVNYNGLVVLGRTRTANGHLFAWCRCTCGKEWRVNEYNLRSGNTKSCGCYATSVRRSPRPSMRVKRDPKPKRVKHGATSGSGYRSPEYRSWLKMKERCLNPNHVHYDRYGGRGVKVCERWSNSFVAFLEDMGSKPTTDHSIDRFPEKDGNYEPGNCRWATDKEQNRNLRSNRMMSADGVTKCVGEWAEITGLTRNTIYHRLRTGWAPEEIVSTPSQNAHHKRRGHSTKKAK